MAETLPFTGMLVKKASWKNVKTACAG